MDIPGYNVISISGTIVGGTKMRGLIFEWVLEAASGKTTKSDVVGFAQLNFVPWRLRRSV